MFKSKGQNYLLIWGWLWKYYIPREKTDYYINQCGSAPQTDPTQQVNQNGISVATIELDSKGRKYINAISDAGFE